MKFKIQAPFILSLALLTACSVNKDMDQMSESTKDLSSKTSTMADTTAHLAATNDSMSTQISHLTATNDSVLTAVKDTSASAKDTNLALRMSTANAQQSNTQFEKLALAEQNSYMDVRQRDTYAGRPVLLANIDKVNSIEDKVEVAKAYFANFEFQLWKNNGLDDADKLDQLYASGMKEFTVVLHNLMPKDMSKIDIQDFRPETLKLYALALAADEINPNGATGISPMTDLIEQALKLNADLNNGSVGEQSLKEWQKNALNDYKELVFFLQIRENLLAGEPLFESVPAVSDLNKRPLNLDLRNQNLEQIILHTKMMSKAVDTAAYLVSIGEPCLESTELNMVLSNAVVTDSSPVKDSTVRAQAVEAFDAARKAFVTVK